MCVQDCERDIWLSVQVRMKQNRRLVIIQQVNEMSRRLLGRTILYLL